MSKLHLVFGGRVKDPRGLDFDLKTIDLVGVYDSYAAAEDAWRGKAQGTVDDAEMKYVVVHLHRLLEPDATASRGPKQPARLRPSGTAKQQRPLQQQAGGEPADMRRRREQIALPAGKPAHHHLQHDPGDHQPGDVDPAVDAQVVGERSSLGRSSARMRPSPR